MFKTWQNKTSNHLGTETGQNPTEIDRNMFLCFLHFAFFSKLQLIVFSWFRGGLDFWGFEEARVCVMVGIDQRSCAGAS